MKTIRLLANSEFIRFDKDIGRLLAIAEYPDESMLDERMKHDLRIGASLLDAVRQGRLRVRDCQTRFPLNPDAPSVDVLPSLVSVNDFREFVAELGYVVHLGVQPEDNRTDQDESAHNASPESMPPVPTKRVLASQVQDAAILAAIRTTGNDPMALPRWEYNAPGVKAKVREMLVGKDRNFPRKGTQFKHAWDRLRMRVEIAYVG